MAAIDTPWIFQMATPKTQRRSDPADSQHLHAPASPSRQASDSFTTSFSSAAGPNPTYAAFSPATLSSTTKTASAAKRRSTILVHQKSPLLLATPPQITRALAYSHPFLLPLNKLAGLLSWTTGDPWESFLLVVAFWATVLYGDFLLRIAGPLIVVLGLILGMYGRRFSPLSSSGWSESVLTSKEAAAGGGAVEAGNRDRQEGHSKSPSANNGASAGIGSNVASGGKGVKPETATNPAVRAAGASSGHQRAWPSTAEATNTRHQKTLDEMVETLKEFTSRCNILLEPFLELTDFLSTQRTPTSATTRPALTALLVRILLCTPFWFALTLPPWKVVTARRVVLVAGTIMLTWHARVCCVGRTLLWRSMSVRRLAALVTGLEFECLSPSSSPSLSSSASAAANGLVKPGGGSGPRESELTKAIHRSQGGENGIRDRSTGVRFTFIIYENQRRWVGLGWTSSLFTYERAAWTDERNNPVPPRDQFELPEVEDGSRMRWHWVEDSRWRVDGVPDEAVRNDPKNRGEGANGTAAASGGGVGSEWNYDGEGGKMGWVYYDNKWQNGRRGQDSWGRWTRRRKWYRDAELVETDPESPSPSLGPNADENEASSAPPPLADRPSTLPPPTASASDNTSSNLAPAGTAVAASLPSSNGGNGSPGKDGAEKPQEQNEMEDSVSLLSTSSRSGGGGIGSTIRSALRAPALRRRITDTSAVSVGSSGSATAPKRSRKTSSAAASSLDEDYEDTAASLGTSLGLEIQGASMERDQWGIGDDLRMGLE